MYRCIGIFFLATMLFVAGCNKKPTDTTQPPDAVLAVVHANMDCLSREDLAACGALMHPESPGLQQTKQMSEKLFSAYDLRYTLKEVSVESVGTDEAKVKFTQVTEKIAGPAFRNNLTEGIHILRKDNGQWKLYGSQVSKVEYLEK